MSEKQPAQPARKLPFSDEFLRFVAADWAPRPSDLPERAEVAEHTERRRAELSAAFPGERLVIPAGGLKVRSNDCDYLFRPHTAFAYYTGLGADREPDAVLVMEPREGGHDAVLYFRPLAGRDTQEFFGDARYGEFWVGARPTLDHVRAELGIDARHVDELGDALAKDAGIVGIRVVRDADPAVAAQVDTIREQSGAGQTSDAMQEADQALAHHASVARMCKDPWEVGQMRSAIEGTNKGFEQVIATLPEAVRIGRGERWVEGQFGLHARHHGNGVGYESICASGDHANTLHWVKNTGDVREGDLLLLDAGVEVESLFTADITRTLPVSGTFSPVQREIYETVYRAQQAGIAACRPGNQFKDVHAAAIRVIAEFLHSKGLLPEGVSVDDTLGEEGGYHRRWMVHGTSHHLGMDVHDCAMALREEYGEAELKPGMIITVEPGLYFKADDLKVPEEFRGNGVRIEDDVLITEDGCENLSAFMPSAPDEVEAWIARVWREHGVG